jgi:hypothetical protein
MSKGWIIIGFGLLGIAVIYLATHRGQGRTIVNAGAKSTPLITSPSLDDSTGGITTHTQPQTEAAYNTQPTHMADAFGPGQSVPTSYAHELSSDMD